MAPEENEGASVQERLIEACRRNNTELLTDALANRPDPEITSLLNDTTTVLGNHLYHEAAARGNYEIIDLLLDQPSFECDPINRLDGDTPLHVAIRWLNGEPPAQRPFGKALVHMMLEAGSSTRVRNAARLTPLQLVDPANTELRDLIRNHGFASQNAGDFINEPDHAPSQEKPPPPPPSAAHGQPAREEDEDADFSGSDEEDRAEWERRRQGR